MEVNVDRLENELNKIKKKETSFFDIIKPHETLVSEWLAFIFNPSKNGVGNKPIEILLNLVGEDFDLDGQDFINTKTEVCIDEMRRIDILINYEKTLIVIENKLESDENDKQTEAYFEYISNTFKNKSVIKYVYLKPSFNSSIPTKLANDKEDGFVIVTYHNLLSRLMQLTESDFKDKDKYKYLEEFIKSGSIFMDKKIELNDKIEFFVKNKEEISKVIEEYNDQNRLLKESIRKSVLNKLNSEIYKTDEKALDRDYIQFYKENWKSGKSFIIHYEILFKNRDGNSEKEILGEKYIKANIEVHMEGDFNNEILEKIKEKGVEATIRSKGILKLFTTKENIINYENIECDFSESSKIDSTISNLVKKINEIKEDYEKIIDEIINL